MDYNYWTENWIYVILSRVREMKGFYSFKKLGNNKLKKTKQALLKDQIRLKQIEKRCWNLGRIMGM